MNRRNVLVGMGAAAVLTGSKVFANKQGKAHAGESKDAFMEDLAECQDVGLRCQEHCISILSTGDKSMAECMATVREMLSLTRAMMELHAAKSKHAKKLAALCAAACEECKKSCEKHAAHHAICKECAECCDECAKSCKKMAA